jgi:hypothetical protein
LFARSQSRRYRWICACIFAAIYVGQFAVAQENKPQPDVDINVASMVMDCLRREAAKGDKQIVVWMPLENYMKLPSGERKIIAPTVILVAAWEPDATGVTLAPRPGDILVAHDRDGESYPQIQDAEGVPSSAALAYAALRASRVDVSILAGGDLFQIAQFTTFTKSGNNLVKEMTLSVTPEHASEIGICRVPLSASFTFVTDDPFKGAEFELHLTDLNTKKEILVNHDRVKMTVVPPGAKHD